MTFEPLSLPFWPFSPPSISTSWTQKNPEENHLSTLFFSQTHWPPLLGLLLGPNWASRQEQWMLLYWSKATIVGARKSGEEEEEQDATLNILCFKSSQIAALSPLKEQLTVKLTSKLILHSLHSSKNTPFLSRNLWNFSQSPKTTNRVGRFQTGKSFLNTCMSHPANSQTCPISLALFQGAEGGKANAWLHHSTTELASARVHFQTCWPGKHVCKQPWSSDCVSACKWDLAKRLRVCLYLWKTSQWAFRGIWRLGKWRVWVIHTPLSLLWRSLYNF